MGRALWRAKVIVYALLLAWTLVALFPIYWTLSTSVKLGRDVTQGHLIPWVDFSPSWKGWQSLGLSPDTIFADLERARGIPQEVHQQRHLLDRRVGAGRRDRLARGLRPQPLRLQVRPWRNKDISFFFVSQLILPPVVLALPFLVLYKELALLDTRTGLIPRLHV